MVIRIKWFRISIKKYFLIYSTLLIITVLLLLFNYSDNANTTTPITLITINVTTKSRESLKKLYNDAELRQNIYNRKIERLTRKIKNSRVIKFSEHLKYDTNYNVHIFYYAWYGNVEHDGDFHHWNHKYIPDWKKRKRATIPQYNHNAPLDIGSNYYPSIGCYSSRDRNLIKTHINQIKSAGIGVIAISWTPPGMKDSPHKTLPMFLQFAYEQNLKITIHVEPYSNRTPRNLKEHLKQFFDLYLNHPALYKINTPTGKLPLIYIYDSYLISSDSWRELLSPKGELSVRNTEYDAVFIGLLVEIQHRYHIKKSNFDGFYTYFASNGFTYGSSWKNWSNLQKFAKQSNLIFIPSIGPGYIDVRIRPWNAVNTRYRRHGQYYDVAWRSAISSNVKYISVTSFNEWHEGTQIEPAKPMRLGNFTYLDYEPEGGNFYLNLTRWWIGQLSKMHN